MKQYIDKAALVAEIKRRRILVSDPILSGNDLMIGERNALFNLLSFIDTLEVKEVDLEKKKIEWIEQLCKYFKANYLYVSGHESFISDFRRYAKDLK